MRQRIKGLRYTFVLRVTWGTHRGRTAVCKIFQTRKLPSAQLTKVAVFMRHTSTFGELRSFVDKRARCRIPNLYWQQRVLGFVKVLVVGFGGSIVDCISHHRAEDVLAVDGTIGNGSTGRCLLTVLIALPFFFIDDATRVIVGNRTRHPRGFGSARLISYLFPIDGSISLFVARVEFTPNQLLLRLENLLFFSVLRVLLPLHRYREY